MRKNVFGRRLKRDRNERKALFKGLMSSLVLNEKIKTTESKAKAIRGQIEKLVTKTKKEGENTVKFLMEYLSVEAIKKMINNIAPRFINRAGGYTRIIKIGERFSDNAAMVLIEWTEQGIQNSELTIKNQKGKKETDKLSAPGVARKTSKESKKVNKKTATQKELKGK